MGRLLSLINFKLTIINSLENILQIIEQGKSLGILSYIRSANDEIEVLSSKQALDLLVNEYDKNLGAITINYLDTHSHLFFYAQNKGNLKFSISLPFVWRYSLLEGASNGESIPNYEQYIRLGLAICKNIPVTEIHLSII